MLWEGWNGWAGRPGISPSGSLPGSWMGGAIAHIKLTCSRTGVSSPALQAHSVTPVTPHNACRALRNCGKGLPSCRRVPTVLRRAGIRCRLPRRLHGEPQQPMADRTVPGEVAIARGGRQMRTEQCPGFVPRGCRHEPYLPRAPPCRLLAWVPLVRAAVKTPKGPDLYTGPGLSRCGPDGI
jgi:hypothetical protein